MNIKVSTKRQQVGDVWSMSGETLSGGKPLPSLVAAANKAGEGGKFRTFESRLSEVYRQKLAESAGAQIDTQT